MFKPNSKLSSVLISLIPTSNRRQYYLVNIWKIYSKQTNINNLENTKKHYLEKNVRSHQQNLKKIESEKT